MLQLSLLGGLQINQDGVPVTGFVSSKARALLCYLAVSGRPHSREALAGLLWGEMPETKARVNLRKALSNLRKLLAPYLTITPQTVAFNQDSLYRLDVEALQRQVESSITARNGLLNNEQLAALIEVVDLYRGDFLEGFYVRGAPAFEEWVLGQRERLRELVLYALYALAAHHTVQGKYILGLDYTNRLLALDPWREEAHRQMMLLLAGSGQRSAALAQYQTCCQILAEEFGIKPAAETTALYERIRAVNSVRPHNLPPQPTPFVGREGELAEIVALLKNPDCRLLTIIGPGGIGKTRLALQVVEKSEGFLNGVYFVPLDSTTSTDFLNSAIADALDVSFAGKADLKQQLLHYLADKEMLLLLDNFEHLLAGTALLTDILQHTPGVKLLVTSRERLNLQEEWLFEIEGLTFPTRETARTESINLKDYSALQLFVQSARRVQRHFAPSNQEILCVVCICRLVEGMPLAIELASAWLRTLSCLEIVDEIASDLDFLATSLRNIPERHRSLRVVFDHSWNMLSNEEKQVLKKLSVFRGGFKRETAEQVAGATKLILSVLVDKSFLRRDVSGRYEMHELLRQYAAEKLEQTPQI